MSISYKTLSHGSRRLFPSVDSKSYLLHPVIDFLMVGGLSALLLSTCLLFVSKSSSTYTLSWTMFYLAFFVNFPHFLISYQFLYIDSRKRILTDGRSFIAACIVPMALIGYIFYFTVFQKSSPHLGYLINTMYFLVGWHYVKQIIGCMIITSSLKKFYFSKLERMVLLINAVSVWAISYLNGNSVITQRTEWGMSYSTLALPKTALNTAFILTAISFLFFTFLILKKSMKEKKFPPVNSMVAFLTLYIWHIPIIYHPSYFLMIPLFHSLQYLLFSFAYVKNKYTQPNPHFWNSLLKKAMPYILLSFITGALFFHWIPKLLDHWTIYDKAVLGSSFFLFAFTIFLNIHHYFIDAAIWRRENTHFRKYLTSRPQVDTS